MNWLLSHLTLIGLLLQTIGFTCIWISPVFLTAWGGAGLDYVPGHPNTVILWEKRKEYPYWKQHNRVKRDLQYGCFAIGTALQLISEIRTY